MDDEQQFEMLLAQAKDIKTKYWIKQARAAHRSSRSWAKRARQELAFAKKLLAAEPK